MKMISINQVMVLHQKIIDVTGGINGIREKDLLDSALNNAFATFNSIELYESIEKKCANICFAIIKNHPFIDGNKRLGIYIMLILLDHNNINIEFEQNELVDLGLGIAESRYDQESIFNWIKKHEND